MRVEQVGGVEPDLCSVEYGAIAHREVDVGIHSAEGGNEGLVVVLAIVHALFAYAVVEDAEVQAMILVSKALLLGVGRRARDPETGGRFLKVRRSLGAGVQRSYVEGIGGGRIHVEIEPMREDRGGFKLDALGDGTGLQIVDGVALVHIAGDVIDGAGVAVLEADAISIGVDGEPLPLVNDAGLVGGGFLLLGSGGNGGNSGACGGGGLVVVVNGTGRHNAAGCGLAVDRPVGQKPVGCVQRRQPRFKGSRVFRGGGAGGGVAGAGERAHSGSVVGLVQHVDGVGGELGSGGEIELGCYVELVFGVGLVGVGPELLTEFGQRLVGPVVERIGGILMAVGICPLIPHAAAEDAEVRGLGHDCRFAIFAVAVVLVDGAGKSGDALLDDLHIAGRNGQAVVVSLAADHNGAGDERGVGCRGRRRDLGHGGGVRVEFAVVVVVGVRLHLQVPVLAEFGFQAHIFKVGGNLVLVVLLIEPTSRVGVVGEQEFQACAGKRQKPVGRNRRRGSVYRDGSAGATVRVGGRRPVDHAARGTDVWPVGIELDDPGKAG